MRNQGMKGDFEESRLPADMRQLLREQTIDEDQPGTILRDVNVMLGFIAERELKTTSKYYVLPQSCLQELNARLSRPMPHQLNRPQQKSFPEIHGLYLLLRTVGLVAGDGIPPKGRLVVDQEVLSIWRQLNSTEQYFTLLDGWLLQAREETVDGGRSMSNGFFRLTQLYQSMDIHGTSDGGDQVARLLHGTMKLANVGLMQQFGWLQAEYGEPIRGKAAMWHTLRRLPFGDAMYALLQPYEMAFIFPESSVMPYEQLQAAIQPYFPEWQRVLELPEQEFRNGEYTWHVSLGKAWRRIVAPADLDLDDLAGAILDAFGFECDHLYEFELTDRRGRSVRYVESPDVGDVATAEVRLGDLPLPEGAAMTFLFDYGDCWQFLVRLEKVTVAAKRLSAVKVTARGGKAPTQYEPWD